MQRECEKPDIYFGWSSICEISGLLMSDVRKMIQRPSLEVDCCASCMTPDQMMARVTRADEVAAKLSSPSAKGWSGRARGGPLHVPLASRASGPTSSVSRGQPPGIAFGIEGQSAVRPASVTSLGRSPVRALAGRLRSARRPSSTWWLLLPDRRP